MSSPQHNPEIPWHPFEYSRPIFRTDGTVTSWGIIRNEREVEDLLYEERHGLRRRGDGPEQNDEKERENKAPPPSPDLSQEMQRDIEEEDAAHLSLERRMQEIDRQATVDAALQQFAQREMAASRPVARCAGRVTITWASQYCERVACEDCPFVGYFWSVEGERVNSYARNLTATSPCGNWQQAAADFLLSP